MDNENELTEVEEKWLTERFELLNAAQQKQAEMLMEQGKTLAAMMLLLEARPELVPGPGPEPNQEPNPKPLPEPKPEPSPTPSPKPKTYRRGTL